MDFVKSRNSTSRSSTSSNHSNGGGGGSIGSTVSTGSSHKSHASSNNGASYNLEYCTSSSSSLSPFAHAVAAASCPSSAAKTVVNVGIDEVLLSISGGSHISASSLSSDTSSKLCSYKNAVKRKRRATITTLDDKTDPEIGFEPSPKRQQRVPSLYPDEPGSVVSSVYPSPVDEALVHELDTRSSSECLSTGAEYEVVHNDMPDSPSSLRIEGLDGDHDHDHDDDDDDDDRNGGNFTDDDHEEVVVSAASSPSVCSTISSDSTKRYDESVEGIAPHHHLHHQHQHQHHLLLHHHHHHQAFPGSAAELTSSPSSAYHGERTPGQRLCTATSSRGSPCGQPKARQRPKVKSFDDYVSEHYDCMTPATDPEPPRQCPLPALSWANAHDVWQLMCKKDEQASCLRNASMLDQHPSLQPRMRAILLDWLIEVCEVYKLHRETYYLAVDYLDRYLSAQKKVQKTHLQLIGITCLFVAAKVEEIYPPKIGEFAYVTDGACQEADILQHEILLLQALDWNISPVTPMGWLGVYMQLNVNNRTPASFTTTTTTTTAIPTEAPVRPANSAVPADRASGVAQTGSNDAFIYPQFSGMEFVQTAQLLDLCSLDVGINNFPYSIIAAAAISHTFNKETALRCSGLDWQAIQGCARWMEPFFQVISEESHNLHLLEQSEPISSKYGLGHICPNIITDDSHIIQTHTTTMAMFDRVCLLQEQQLSMVTKMKHEASPATGLLCPEGLLTPPASSRKPLGAVPEEHDADDDDEADEEEDGDGDVENRENIAISN